MTKVYKIKGKEIEELPIGLTENEARLHGKTDLFLLFNKMNEILEALSDKEEGKQEEWKGCGICNCKYPQFCEGCYKADYKCRVCDNEPKQST